MFFIARWCNPSDLHGDIWNADVGADIHFQMMSSVDKLLYFRPTSITTPCSDIPTTAAEMPKHGPDLKLGPSCGCELHFGCRTKPKANASSRLLRYSVVMTFGVPGFQGPVCSSTDLGLPWPYRTLHQS